MFKLLINTINKRFCIAPELQKTYELLYQIKDITMLRGLKNKQPYIKINNQKIDLSKYQLLFELSEDLGTTNGPIQFYDDKMDIYHPTTPMGIIFMDSFYIFAQRNLYYVVNNQPIVKLTQSQQFAPTFCSPILEDVCRQSLHELPDDEQQQLNGAYIHNLLISNTLKYGMNHKLQKIRLKQLMKVVERGLSSLQKQINQILLKVELKANKRLKYFTNFMLTQYALIHYFIYFHLSWDIMEPITVILANFDIFVAYYFFVMKGRDWSLQSLHKNYVEQRKMSFLQKNGINVQKYKQLCAIKQNLEFRLSLLSKNPYELIKTFEKPIKLLDTR